MSPLHQILTRMNELRVSQRELAAYLMVSEARISQLLREPFNPTLRTLEDICVALGMQIEVGRAAA